MLLQHGNLQIQSSELCSQRKGKRIGKERKGNTSFLFLPSPQDRKRKDKKEKEGKGKKRKGMQRNSEERKRKETTEKERTGKDKGWRK